MIVTLKNTPLPERRSLRNRANDAIIECLVDHDAGSLHFRVNCPSNNAAAFYNNFKSWEHYVALPLLDAEVSSSASSPSSSAI